LAAIIASLSTRRSSPSDEDRAEVEVVVGVGFSDREQPGSTTTAKAKLQSTMWRKQHVGSKRDLITNLLARTRKREQEWRTE
jgi:hypothetical protein